MSLRWWMVCVLLGGCFSPKLGDQPFSCGDQPPRCPSGYVCLDGTCVRRGLADAAIDADAPIAIDGAVPPDARRDAAVDAQRDAAVDARAADAPTVKVDAPPVVIDAPPVAPDACVATCTADGEQLITCGPTPAIVSCPAGCDRTHVPNTCLYLDPLLLAPDTCKSPGGPQPAFAPGKTILDTTACNGGTVVAQASGLPDLCVYRWADVNIGGDRVVTFAGTRVPAIVGTSSMAIDGTVEVAGHGDAGGPATGADTLGQGGPGATDVAQGGGGAGSATEGGAGGGTAAGDTGGAAGVAIPRATGLWPGAFGGIGGPCLLCERSTGGGAGGALYLVSCRPLRLGASAKISAGGGGGRGGVGGGGDGGGSGGDVFVEAPELLVEGGVLAANGGGGGSGAGLAAAAGQRGQDGQLSATPAAGGPSVSGSGAGGYGGTVGAILVGVAPAPGGAGQAGTGGGGGGGAAGRIRLATRPDRPIALPATTVISPEALFGTILRTP